MSTEGLRGHTVNIMYFAIKNGASGLRDMPKLIRNAITDRIWEGWKDINSGEYYSQPDFVSFVTHPLPDGLNATIPQIKALCKDDRDVIDLIDTETTRKPGGANNPEGNNQYEKKEVVNHNNIMNDQTESKATQGTSIEYTLRRLRKDHPELHEKVLANEMSPNQAAILAGFRKKTVTITVDVEAIARKLKEILTPEEMRQIMAIWSKS